MCSAGAVAWAVHDAYGVPMTSPDAVPDTVRTDPPRVGGDREMLEAWLDYYRATLLHKCAGLEPVQLVERSCPPSPMSLIGLVRHMVEMERAYVHRLADRDTPLLYCTDASPDGDFDDVSADTVAADLVTFADHCERSRAVLSGLSLDDLFGRDQQYSVRWVFHYLVKEYARHIGHADLLRERIDGAVGE
jgi:hypothetical protein